MNRVSKTIFIILIVLFFLLSFFLTIKMTFEKTNVNQSVNVTVSSEQKNKINLNTAGEKQLESIPSVGKRKAQKIIDYRYKHKIGNIEDLRNIKGIGDETIESLKSEVFVE